MMPRTHFMAGMLVTALLAAVFEISLWHVFLGGIIAAAIDIDHVLCFWLKHGHLSIGMAWDSSTKHLDRIRSRYVHGRLGIVFFGLASLGISFYSLTLAAILYLAFISHLLLDHAHLKAIDKELIHAGHYIYPITITELTIDVLVFNLLLITLLYFNLV